MDCSSLSIPINSPLPDNFFMIDLERDNRNIDQSSYEDLADKIIL